MTIFTTNRESRYFERMMKEVPGVMYGGDRGRHYNPDIQKEARKVEKAIVQNRNDGFSLKI